MYRYAGFIYNYDGTDIRRDPDCLDYEPEDDYYDDYEENEEDEDDEEQDD